MYVAFSITCLFDSWSWWQYQCNYSRAPKLKEILKVGLLLPWTIKSRFKLVADCNWSWFKKAQQIVSHEGKTLKSLCRMVFTSFVNAEHLQPTLNKPASRSVHVWWLFSSQGELTSLLIELLHTLSQNKMSYHKSRPGKPSLWKSNMIVMDDRHIP